MTNKLTAKDLWHIPRKREFVKFIVMVIPYIAWTVITGRKTDISIEWEVEESKK